MNDDADAIAIFLLLALTLAACDGWRWRVPDPCVRCEERQEGARER